VNNNRDARLKKFYYIFLLFIQIVIVSCAGGAKAPVEPAPDSVAEADVGNASGTTEPEQQAQNVEDDQALVDEPAQAPEEETVTGELAEPELDLVSLLGSRAEVDSPAPPPVEPPVIAALPEPAAEGVLETPPPNSPPVPESPLPAPAAERTPPAVTPTPPAQTVRPPAYLRPAEEERPPALVREPVPLPAPPPVSPEPPITPLPQPSDLQDKSGEETIVFSRVVRATVGQLVEVPFRGSGWVYLGEIGSRRGIVYDSRRLDPEGLSFIFRAEAAGTYTLKFYKQDFIRDLILNDYVQVLVGEVQQSAGSGWFNAPVDRGRVVAEPRWPSSLEEAERRGGPASGAANAPAVNADATQTAEPSSQVSGRAVPAPEAAGTPQAGTPPSAVTPTANTTAGGTTDAAGAGIPQSAAETPPAAPASAAAADSQTAGQPPANASNAPVPASAANAPNAPAAAEAVSSLPADSPPDAYLQKAKEAFDSGKVASAIALLDQFRERYPSGSDEAYWLYGQFYEANSPGRDILTALDYYRRLVREYPQSSRVSDARRRIAYLERYYLYNN
jgi:TolA-binding protein